MFKRQKIDWRSINKLPQLRILKIGINLRVKSWRLHSLCANLQDLRREYLKEAEKK